MLSLLMASISNTTQLESRQTTSTRILLKQITSRTILTNQFHCESLYLTFSLTVTVITCFAFLRCAELEKKAGRQPRFSLRDCKAVCPGICMARCPAGYHYDPESKCCYRRSTYSRPQVSAHDSLNYNLEHTS